MEEIIEEQIENVVILNEQPEFRVDSEEEVSANFFIVCEADENGLAKSVYEYNICGVSLLNWVARACEKQPMVLRCSEDEIIKTIKPYLNGADYSVVLYANTPLVNKQHLKDLLAFVSARHMNALKLKKGFVFRNEYIRNVDEIYSIDTYDFSSNDFFEVKNLDDMEVAREFLFRKLIKFHGLNGVYFDNPNMVTIDAGAELGYGSKISSNVVVSGNSVIGNDTELLENVLVKNSKIGSDVKIGEGAAIINSVIKDGTVIGAGSVIKGSVIGNNCNISEKVDILSSGIKSNCNVLECTKLDNARVMEDVSIGRFCLILGDETPAVLSNGVEVGNNTQIVACKLDENVKISSNKNVTRNVHAGEKL